MKIFKLSTCLLVSAVICFMAGSSIVTLAQTVITGESCKTNGYFTCNNLSYIQCINQAEGTTCYHCTATNNLPGKICVALEGGSCIPNNNVYNCGTRDVGICYTAGCYDRQPSGLCDAVRGCN